MDAEGRASNSTAQVVRRDEIEKWLEFGADVYDQLEAVGLKISAQLSVSASKKLRLLKYSTDQQFTPSPANERSIFIALVGDVVNSKVGTSYILSESEGTELPT